MQLNKQKKMKLLHADARQAHASEGWQRTAKATFTLHAHCTVRGLPLLQNDPCQDTLRYGVKPLIQARWTSFDTKLSLP